MFVFGAICEKVFFIYQTISKKNYDWYKQNRCAGDVAEKFSNWPNLGKNYAINWNYLIFIA